MSALTNILDYYFEPLTTVFNREIAESIVNQPLDPRLAARVVELGQKSQDGTLTDEERDEYQTIIDAGDMISLLKSKARHFLDEHPG